MYHSKQSCFPHITTFSSILAERANLQVQYCIISHQKTLAVCVVQERAVSFVTKYQLLFWQAEELLFITGWCFFSVLATNTLCLSHTTNKHKFSTLTQIVSATWPFFTLPMCYFHASRWRNIVYNIFQALLSLSSFTLIFFPGFMAGCITFLAPLDSRFCFYVRWRSVTAPQYNTAIYSYRTHAEVLN